MKFSRDDISSVTIRRINPGEIKVGDELFTTDVALSVDGTRHNFCVEAIEELTEADLEPILADSPEILILGTGWQVHRPSRELVFAMARRGIGFEAMDTPAACRTFNILASEGRRVAALLKVSE